MFILYHCLDARSFRPLWAMEELGQTYELRMLPFPPRQLARRFLEINPLGTIPYFIDGETRMTESSAICQYLATRAGGSDLAVREDEPDFGLYLNWLHFGEATLTFPQTLVLRYSRLETPERRLPRIVEDYTRWFHGRLRGIENAIRNRDYLCAGRFTACDISVGFALKMAETLDLDGGFTPNVRDYWTRLSARPGYQAAMAAQQRAENSAGVD